MFFAFAYKGGSLRASFDGLLVEVVETSHGTVLEGAECFGTIRLNAIYSNLEPELWWQSL